MIFLTTYLLNEGLTTADVSQICACFELRTIRKGEFFVKENQKADYLGFVETGLLQYFVLLPDGQEKTTYMALSHTFMASLLALLSASPAAENIRAVTDATVWVITKTNLEKLRFEIQGFNAFYTHLLEWQICCIEKSRLDFLLLTAEQRYAKILEQEPHLLQQIPLQYLASMLGVTPRHLSRIRKNIR
ncbi:cAMP-binding domain of CRP or a regulatory subunit of cAMP-dependent protein kinases [Flexibacter flexilis DSM 6793]|uniref:cAMP-binding domain of CRP or a regulatory subunit of cAMP-dependent protein kinases n=1 Tax=Flexibacter flexilis DSM 6793 TaxID=927664 RepID=A0A1I1DRY7_9BACT|nr:Crp/Fnr family transcriptional regulator [Flexibacter flexilis]SFB77166.1 cAMP-binding domain of CRP or a regulatory subunit of cAMP-dependent protein kinases [Flexibacter flexilis DSM 6793]